MFLLIGSAYEDGTDGGLDLFIPERFATREQARKKLLSQIQDDFITFDIDCSSSLKKQLNGYLLSGSIDGWDEEITGGDSDVMSYEISIDNDSADLFIIREYSCYASKYSIFNLEELPKKQEEKL